MTASSQTPLSSLPALSTLKDQARRLRQSLAAQGIEITHSKALELLARQYGFRDWNTLSARAPAAAIRIPRVGDPVSGRYMGHPYTGTLKGIRHLSDQGAHQVSIQLDTPIDVVSFDSFSALRHRISGTIDRFGRSFRHRSDGVAHLVVDWPDG